MIGIDMKAWFVPSFKDSDKLTKEERRAATVMGDIVYVNYAHKYFTAEFEDRGAKFKESFNFSDCGKTVRVRG
jgi:hypothetical protein